MPLPAEKIFRGGIMAFKIDTYCTELGGAKNHVFRRNFFFPCDETLPENIRRFQEEYRYTDCYQCLYRYSAQDENALLYAPFYLDLDADITTEKKYNQIRPYVMRAWLFFTQILKLRPEEIGFYFSGSKGFHLTVDPRILGIVPDRNLNVMYKALALHLYSSYKIPIIDLRIYDKRRLFRMPNTVNSKTGLYKVPLTLTQFRQFSFSELCDYAKEAKEEPERPSRINRDAAILFQNRTRAYKHTGTKEAKPEITYTIPETKQELLPCVQKILEDGAVRGSRNNTLIILASCLFQSGYKFEEVENVITDWNQLNEPPLDMHELSATIHSAWTMLKNGRRYGCSSIKELGLCASNECKLGEQYGNRNN